MARRRGSVSRFMDGFNDGYDTVGKVVQDYRLGQVAAQAPDQVAEASGADQLAAAQASLEQAKAANPENAAAIARGH